jgi:hypothetical protein
MSAWSKSVELGARWPHNMQAMRNKARHRWARPQTAPEQTDFGEMNMNRHARWVSAMAVASLMGQIALAPCAQARARPPMMTWGKAGIGFEEYRKDPWIAP